MCREGKSRRGSDGSGRLARIGRMVFLRTHGQSEWSRVSMVVSRMIVERKRCSVDC